MDQKTIETLAGRVNKLERENRKLKRLVTGVLIGITAVAIMGQVKPTRVPKLIEAEKFILRDARGNVRAELATESYDPQKCTKVVDFNPFLL